MFLWTLEYSTQKFRSWLHQEDLQRAHSTKCEFWRNVRIHLTELHILRCWIDDELKMQQPQLNIQQHSKSRNQPFSCFTTRAKFCRPTGGKPHHLNGLWGGYYSLLRKATIRWTPSKLSEVSARDDIWRAFSNGSQSPLPPFLSVCRLSDVHWTFCWTVGDPLLRSFWPLWSYGTHKIARGQDQCQAVSVQ